MARLMEVAVKDLFGRGVSNEYVSETEELRGIRGKLSLAQCISSGKFRYAKAVCSFDEFGPDHPVNQIIKASLRTLLLQQDLAHENVITMRECLGRLEQVSDLPLSAALFGKVRIHSNTRHYAFVLELCRLIANCLVVSSESKEIKLANFLDDSTKMDRIFEKFVKNFYSKNLSNAVVWSPKFQWEIDSIDSEFVDRVPELRTDVVIDVEDLRMIIDAKYYVEAMRQSHGGGFKFRRDHLSQLMEYMRTSNKKRTVATHGLLLYPTVDQSINSSGKIEGFEIRVATVDLCADWKTIERQMLQLFSACRNAPEVLAA